MRKKMRKPVALLLVFLMLFVLVADSGIYVRAEEATVDEESTVQEITEEGTVKEGEQETEQEVSADDVSEIEEENIEDSVETEELTETEELVNEEEKTELEENIQPEVAEESSDEAAKSEDEMLTKEFSETDSEEIEEKKQDELHEVGTIVNVEPISEVFSLKRFLSSARSNTVKDLEGNDVSLSADWIFPNEGNIGITNWKRSKNADGKVHSFDNLKTSVWTWEQLSAVGDTGWVTNLEEVWDGSRSANHYHDDYISNGVITAIDGSLYDSATWTHNGTNNSEATLHRFQGEFDITTYDPNNYSFTVSSVVGNDIIYINDDIYVFVYPEGATVTQENYIDYLAFWTGTSNADSFNPGAKFGGYPATTVLGTAADTDKSGLKAVTDGWHLKAAKDNIGNIILNSYNTDGTTKFIIDVFTDDFITGGGMYRPVINATAMKRHELKFKKVDSIDHTGISGAEFMLYGDGLKYNATSSEDGGIVIMNIPTGTYTLVETKAPDNYTASGRTWTVVMSENGEYTITANDGSTWSSSSDKGVYAIENTPNTLKLTISKVVDGNGADTDKEFSFAVFTSNAYKKVEGTGNITGDAGNYTVTLKHGQSVTLTLPTGTEYTINENEIDGYTKTEVTGDESGILEGGNKSVTYKNMIQERTLKLSKTVEGNLEDKNKKFEFTVNFKIKGNDIDCNSFLPIEEEMVEKISTGNYKVKLADGEYVEFKVPYETVYTVAENDYSSNSVTSIAASDAYCVEGNTATGTITKDIEVPYTNIVKKTLTISKSVEGLFADKNKEFDFKLSIKKWNDNIEHLGYSTITNENVEVVGNNGEYTVKLKDGESVAFTLPYDTKYTLTEATPDDYVLTKSTVNLAEEKELKEDTVVNVTNTAKVTELILKKDVTGLTGNEKKNFKFTVKLTKSDGNPFENLAAEGVTHHGKGVYTVELKDYIDDDGKEYSAGIVKLYPLPYGIKYEILEDDYTSHGYKTEYEKNSVGELTDNNVREPYKVDEGMFSATETSKVTNIALEKKLEVSKKVSGDSDAKQKEFNFTLKVTYADGETYQKPIHGTQSVLGSGLYTFTLKHGEKVEFTLPQHCNYILEEQDYSKIGYTTCYSHSIKNAKNEYEAVVNEKIGKTIAGKLTEDQKVVYLNQEPVNLRITKQVEGNGGDRTGKFEFTLKLEKSGKAIEYTNCNLEGAQITEIEKGVYKILMGHKDSVIFRVPYGTKYEVVEKDYSYKEYVTTVNGEESRQSSGKLKNTENETIIKFTNTREVTPMIYLAPKTGDSSNAVVWLGVLAIAVISIVVVNKKRKRP